MKNSFSPKQVARALDVSESSLKRWCDRGLIPTMRTAGGHRRIALSDIVSFVRGSDQTLTRPEILGLPPISGSGERVLGRTRDHLLNALAKGDEQACRRVTVELFLAGYKMSEICDEVLTHVMTRVGELWECGDLEVYQERLGCEICSHILDDCRDYVPHPPAGSPIAIGGTPEGDPYTLATQMAELVFKESGWQAISLGSGLPLATLAAAVRDKQPRLVWLSISSLQNPDQFVEDYTAFHAGLAPGVAVVLGGQAITPAIRRQLRFFACCDNFQQLGEIATTLAVA